MQRYALVKSSNQLGLIPSSSTSNLTLESDSERPQGFLGTRLANSNEIVNNGFPDTDIRVGYSNGVSGSDKIPFEKFYYLLSQSDLLSLGVEKGAETNVSDDVTSKDRSYIVNYFTGEVYDVANKKYYQTDTTSEEYVYTKPTGVNVDSKNYVFDDN